ncbi:hypothetical protein BEK98_39290 [Streptomyces diastatochromogenes]|uniref:DUF6777 domain-containing protein n=1 Tax=Streptomyces diastatochromogenes TaxID=42236 RepID=A0A233S0V2_STRDA|nr:hypothetical protein BEK98_39290 [Streptomyces diastatochromogenes]
MVAAVVVALVLTRPGGGGTAQGGEVFLQAASKTGPDPFMESTATETSASPKTTAPGKTSGPGKTSAPATTASPGTTPQATTSAPVNQIRAVDGGAPGLYSGVQNRPSCDVEKQIKVLQADPAKNRAYAAEAGIQPSAVPAYLRSLTPMTLRADTRVTNHGYRSGSGTSYQAVLQSGTAVLVDGHGVPRARCACGNPLTPPVAQRTTPRQTGDHWASYQPTSVIVVRPTTVVVNVFVVYDSHHDDWFHRYRGDDSGRRDRQTKPPRDAYPWIGPTPTSTGPSNSSSSFFFSESPSSESPSSSSSTSPSSESPSSKSPSSESPSSESPSSESPSSESPSSESPSSESPSSESPSSESPSSESPSSESPSSESPSSESPSSESPSTEGSTSGPPSSESSVSEPPSSKSESAQTGQSAERSSAAETSAPEQPPAENSPAENSPAENAPAT